MRGTLKSRKGIEDEAKTTARFRQYWHLASWQVQDPVYVNPGGRANSLLLPHRLQHNFHPLSQCGIRIFPALSLGWGRALGELNRSPIIRFVLVRESARPRYKAVFLSLIRSVGVIVGGVRGLYSGCWVCYKESCPWRNRPSVVASVDSHREGGRRTGKMGWGLVTGPDLANGGRDWKDWLFRA